MINGLLAQEELLVLLHVQVQLIQFVINIISYYIINQLKVSIVSVLKEHLSIFIYILYSVLNNSQGWGIRNLLLEKLQFTSTP